MSVLVALAILSAMITATLWQILVTRRTLEHREFELQAVWLTRSGVERAAAQLLARADAYTDETIELVPRSSVQIELKPEQGNPDTFRVTAAARYPADIEDSVVRSMTQRFRREVDGGSVRLLALSDR
jgi:type II secretory pathway component PulK